MDKKMLDQFFWLGTLFGFIVVLGTASVLFLIGPETSCECPEDLRVLDCGRGFVGECPEICFHEGTDSFIIFQETNTNLNIIKEYWIEDGYYYADNADIDDLELV